MIGVRILGGVRGDAGSVSIQQEPGAVFVNVTRAGGTNLTPAAARELARQLYVIARRVEHERPIEPGAMLRPVRPADSEGGRNRG